MRTTAPVLAHFDADKETWLETDASDFVAAAVLPQRDDEGVLRPFAFLSHRMIPAQCNYGVYDKELLAIVRAFEEWRTELAGTLTPIGVVAANVSIGDRLDGPSSLPSSISAYEIGLVGGERNPTRSRAAQVTYHETTVTHAEDTKYRRCCDRVCPSTKAHIRRSRTPTR